MTEREIERERKRQGGKENESLPAMASIPRIAYATIKQMAIVDQPLLSDIYRYMM